MLPDGDSRKSHHQQVALSSYGGCQGCIEMVPLPRRIGVEDSVLPQRPPIWEVMSQQSPKVGNVGRGKGFAPLLPEIIPLRMTCKTIASCYY